MIRPDCVYYANNTKDCPHQMFDILAALPWRITTFITYHCQIRQLKILIQLVPQGSYFAKVIDSIAGKIVILLDETVRILPEPSLWILLKRSYFN